MSRLIVGATIFDGVSDEPIQGQAIWVEGGRIKAIGPRSELPTQSATELIDAAGKYVIPGLMDANLHLLVDLRLENLVRHEDHFEDLIIEAAQVALKNGLTTVFDTYGPRLPLMAVRDRIEAGEIIGSRIFCSGNIIGLDGPFSRDFFPKNLEVASSALTERVNALWVENVGPALSWMTPEQVAIEVRAYAQKGIDFVKYASSEHRRNEPTSSLIFSPRVQSAIVAEAHRAGLTAQAHTTSVESLGIAIEAGCDLIQHCNFTGPTLIPPATIEMMVARRVGAVLFPYTERYQEWSKGNIGAGRIAAMDGNCRNLSQAGAKLLLGTDASILGPEMAADPELGRFVVTLAEDNLSALGKGGHFAWLKAMEEKGCPPMALLRAATANIAAAYGKDKDLGTLEPGKMADLVILDRNPLESAEHYRDISLVMKGGRVIDHEALPLRPILTRPLPEPSAEVLTYRAHRALSD